MTAIRNFSARFAVIGLCTALVAACASQPQYSVTPTAPPPPPPAPAPLPPPPAPPPPRDPEVPLAAPSTRVEAAPLAPVGPRAPTPPAGTPAPAPARPAPPPPATGPIAPTSAPQPASPWVQPPVAADIPRTVTVQRGETLFDVAERVRTPLRAIIELNSLPPPYELAPGTVLRVPPPVQYGVRAGDTLFGIARRFNIDPRSLANLNGMALETPLRTGQLVGLPALARDQGINPQANGPSPTGMALATAPRPAPARAAASGVRPQPGPPPAVAAGPSDSQIASVGRGKFTWPVRGQIVSTFGPKGPGQRNDGLNIASAVGQRVAAAAAGEVVFAGDLPSFGQLVLLKHDGGWVTAYAHLSKVSVKMRDRVGQGQEVGQVGQTGMVDSPQLHFEIRYAPTPTDKARPVDPTMLLPS